MDIPDVLTDQDVGLSFMPIHCMEIPDVINIKPISQMSVRSDGDRGISTCKTPFHAHIWRSLMSSILGPYLGMPIYVNIVLINPYDLIKHWKSIHSERLCDLTL